MNPGNVPAGSGGSPTVQPPREIEASFWVWVGGAVLSLLTVVLLLVDMDEVINLAVQSYRDRPARGVSEQQVVSVARTLVYVTAVLYVIVAGLFVFLAYMMRGGRNWARITLTVLAALVVIFSFGDTTVLGLLTLAAAVIAAVLFYLPNANAYFTGMNRHR